MLTLLLITFATHAAAAETVTVTESAGIARHQEPVCLTHNNAERCLFITIGANETRTFPTAQLLPKDRLLIHEATPAATGFRIENEHFLADLTPRTVKDKLEDSGTLRTLLFKPLQLELRRTQNRMHWAPSFQRVGVRGYTSMAMWTPVQKHRRTVLPGAMIFHREGHTTGYPEIHMDLEYRFFAHVPYFLFRSKLTIANPIEMFWLRNQEMTMDDLFTHVAWPDKSGRPVIVDFEARKPILKNQPLPADIPWVAFLNLEKGYGYGAVALSYTATKTANPITSINDGADNGKYWDRRIIDQTPTHLTTGDTFTEHTAFVLFRCAPQSAATPRALEEFLTWEKKLRHPLQVRWKDTQ